MISAAISARQASSCRWFRGPARLALTARAQEVGGQTLVLVTVSIPGWHQGPQVLQAWQQAQDGVAIPMGQEGAQAVVAVEGMAGLAMRPVELAADGHPVMANITVEPACVNHDAVGGDGSLLVDQHAGAVHVTPDGEGFATGFPDPLTAAERQ